MATVMTGVPSIVMGLFVYLIVDDAVRLLGLRRRARARLPDAAGRDRLDRADAARWSPITCARRRYALGATKSRTILTVVLPAALPGIVSGALLAIARAAGETAPLLFAVGAATAYNPNLFREANTALSLQIFGNATSSFVAAQDRAWGAALTLVLLTFVLTAGRARSLPRASRSRGRRHDRGETHAKAVVEPSPTQPTARRCR